MIEEENETETKDMIEQLFIYKGKLMSKIP